MVELLLSEVDSRVGPKWTDDQAVLPRACTDQPSGEWHEFVIPAPPADANASRTGLGNLFGMEQEKELRSLSSSGGAFALPM